MHIDNFIFWLHHRVIFLPHIILNSSGECLSLLRVVRSSNIFGSTLVQIYCDHWVGLCKCVLKHQ